MPTSKKCPRGRPCCARTSSAQGQPSPETEPQRDISGSDLVRDLTIATHGLEPDELEALSTTEAAALYMVLDRYMAVLWQAHRQTLFPLFMATFGELVAEATEQDEPEDPTPAH